MRAKLGAPKAITAAAHKLARIIFHLISTRQDYTRAGWDDLAEGALYPLYHVARWIAAAAGAEVLSASTQGGVTQIVWRKDGFRQALVANLTAERQPMPELGFNASAVTLLDAAASSQSPEDLPKTLDAYATAFLDERGTK